MGRKKQEKYLNRNINFGRKGEISREIVEAIIKRKGNWGLSEEIRRALIFTFSNDKFFTQDKINKILERRKRNLQQVHELSKQLDKDEEELNKLGYKLKELE